MSASADVLGKSRGLVPKTVLYLLGSAFTTVACFVLLLLISSPSLVGGLLLTESTMVLRFGVLGVVGLSFYFGQVVLREDPPDTDELEFDISWSELLGISVSYYSLLSGTTVALGMFLVSQGHLQIALLAVLLVGPIDVELAQKVNASPITIIVATTYALGYALGIITSTAGRTIEPRQIATISLERFKRGRRRIRGI